jgi:hypothetical protein
MLLSSNFWPLSSGFCTMRLRVWLGTSYIYIYMFGCAGCSSVGNLHLRYLVYVDSVQKNAVSRWEKSW